MIGTRKTSSKYPSNMPDTIPAPEKPMTRFEAQRHFGLFAPHDIVMFGFIAVCSLVDAVLLLGHYVFKSEISYAHFFIVACAAIACGLAWLIVLAYRILVFILDLHASVALMPESAARIAAGYFEGRKPK